MTWDLIKANSTASVDFNCPFRAVHELLSVSGSNGDIFTILNNE